MILAAGVSTGIGISRAKLISRRNDNIRLRSTASIETELARLDSCIKTVSEELQCLSNNLSDSRCELTKGMMDRYLKVINNYGLIQDIRKMIKENNISAEYAVANLLDNSKRMIEGLDDEYLNERAEDIEEIKRRMLSKLTGSVPASTPNLMEECIIVADDLTPGDVLTMDPNFIKGIVTIAGGPVSSSSIMARHKNIPAVMGVGYEGYRIKNGDILIVDGSRGKVIINPDEKELMLYTGNAMRM